MFLYALVYTNTVPNYYFGGKIFYFFLGATLLWISPPIKH